MILNVGAQNKKLSDAGSKPKDTTHRTLTSNKYAAKIATKKNASSGADSSGMKTIQHESRSKIKRSDQVKGSFEGLDKSSRADITMNGSGYLNPSYQTARNNKTFASSNSLNFSQSSFTGSNLSDIINNISGVSRPGSSSSIVQEMNRKNNLI
jgi:hypothetical protein